MSKKIRVGVLFGGKSAEHEVSLLSAKSIIDALDRSKYEVVLIGIGKNGEWYLRDNSEFLLNAHDPKKVLMQESKSPVALIPKACGNTLVSLSPEGKESPIDVVFPVLHGPNGEDGTIQGLLKLAGIPFVGPSVLSSSVCMDKDVMKRLLRDAGLPIAKFLVFTNPDVNFEEVERTLGLPFFIKPANLGSSVGISKVHCEEEFESALKAAFTYDRKIIIEEAIDGREIECSVLGNEHPSASLPGEVIPQHEFYSYEAKYLDDNGAHFQIPVSLESPTLHRIQDLAIKAYKALCCEGMARIDFFLKANGEVLINELNTIPGFTKISMYPKLWEVSGLAFTSLIDKLIQLALERFEKEQKLNLTWRECDEPAAELPEIQSGDRPR